MKLTATREDILGPVQNVIGVVERRQTMPVLSNVLLSARNGKFAVTGTDLEVELVSAMALTVQTPGDITDLPGDDDGDMLVARHPAGVTRGRNGYADGGRRSLGGARWAQPIHSVDVAGCGVPAGRGDQRPAGVASAAG